MRNDKSFAERRKGEKVMDGKLQVTEFPRCGNCGWLTYRFNKVWCDIHTTPHPQDICDDWKPKEEAKDD